MKKIIFLAVLVWISISGYSQTWTAGTGKLYSSPPITTKIGIGTSIPEAGLHIYSHTEYTDAAILASTPMAHNHLIVRNEATVPVNCVVFSFQHAFQNSRNNGYINFHRGATSSGGFLSFGTFGIERMRINTDGNVGIGTTTPQSKLDVNGSIYSKAQTIEHNTDSDFQYAMFVSVNREYTKAIGVRNTQLGEVFAVLGNGVTYTRKLYAETIEVRSDAIGTCWYDHVFAPDYKLRSLKELELFVKENRHLPDIPSEEEVKENGIDVFKMNALLVKKVEELTLYIIELEKRISEIESKKGDK